MAVKSELEECESTGSRMAVKSELEKYEYRQQNGCKVRPRGV